MSKRTTIAFIVTILILIIGCDTTFKAKKVMSEKIKKGVLGTYDIYLVENLPATHLKDSLLLFFVREKLKKIAKTNTFLDEQGFVFYFDVSCTRGYAENYENLKGSEHIMERCEEEYIETFKYIKTKNNPDVWCLKYPKEIKDTIYFK